MPINASPEYCKAEKEYLMADGDEARIEALEKMISLAPSHKGGENLRKNLKIRLKKLKEKQEKIKKKKKGRKEGIKKGGIQVVLIGFTNSGKSSLLSCLTNAKPEIADYEFTTKKAIIGTLCYEDVKFQMIDMPAVNYESFDKGVMNTADILLIIIDKIEQIDEIIKFLDKTIGKRIIVFNKIDLLNSEEKRKIEANFKSKKYNFCLISCRSKEGINQLKEKIFQNSGIIRVYTKKHGQKIDNQPVIMKPDSIVEELANKVFRKAKIKEARITGPSSKFPNQKVKLTHKLKDKDVVEFKIE